MGNQLCPATIARHLHQRAQISRLDQVDYHKKQAAYASECQSRLPDSIETSFTTTLSAALLSQRLLTPLLTFTHCYNLYFKIENYIFALFC